MSRGKLGPPNGTVVQASSRPKLRPHGLRGYQFIDYGSQFFRLDKIKGIIIIDDLHPDTDKKAGTIMNPLTMHRLKVALQSLIYLALVFFLLREEEERTKIEECTGFDAPPRALVRRYHDFLIDHSSFEERSRRRVVLVVLDPKVEAKEVISNFCTQREFTARLIDRLNELGASVIALDKAYDPNRCAADDPGTNQLQEAIHRSHAIVTRGIDTRLTSEPSLGNRKHCLLLRNDFNLHLDLPEDRNGLSRLDANTNLAPLAWPVRVVDESKNIDQVEDLPTFSLVTARAAEPDSVEARRLQRALDRHVQPYSTRVDIPLFSATKVLCGTRYTDATKWRNCKSDERLAELRDAVVIFGDHIGDTDWHPDPDPQKRGIYGVDLHANYIAALLDKRYYMPLFSPTGNLIFLGFALLLLHICFHFFKPLWLTVLIAAVAWVVIVALSFLIISHTGYLFTIWIQGITLTTILVTALHHWTTTQD